MEKPMSKQLGVDYIYVLGTEANMQLQTYIGKYHQDNPNDLQDIREIDRTILTTPFGHNLMNREPSFRGKDFAEAGMCLSGMYLSEEEFDILREATELLSYVNSFNKLLGVK